MNKKLEDTLNWAGVSIYEDAINSKLPRKRNKILLKKKWVTVTSKISNKLVLLASKIHNPSKGKK